MIADNRHRHCCVRCATAPVPAQVIELLPGRFALVATAAGLEEVNLATVEARIGDVVLVHAGEAVAAAAEWDSSPQLSGAAGAGPGRHRAV